MSIPVYCYEHGDVLIELEKMPDRHAFDNWCKCASMIVLEKYGDRVRVQHRLNPADVRILEFSQTGSPAVCEQLVNGSYFVTSLPLGGN